MTNSYSYRWIGWFCPECDEPNKVEWRICHNCEYDRTGTHTEMVAL